MLVIFTFNATKPEREKWNEALRMEQFFWFDGMFKSINCMENYTKWFQKEQKINGWQWLFCPNEDTCENPFFIRGKSVKQKTHAHTGTNHSHVWSSVIRKRIRKWFTLVDKNKANGKWKTDTRSLFVLMFRFLSSISWFWIVYQIFYKTVSAQRVLATWIHIDCRADATTALMYSRGCDGDDDCDHNDDRNCNCCTNSFSQSDCHRFYAFWLEKERDRHDDVNTTMIYFSLFFSSVQLSSVEDTKKKKQYW